MVSEDPAGLVTWVRSLPLISRGAEAEIRRGKWMGLEAVFKLRVRRVYMHPRLDQELREQRTRKEARLLARAHDLGASVPRLLAVLPRSGLIIMEYIGGRTLRDLINMEGPVPSLIEGAGRVLGRLHRGWIAHGDPTTSNYIESDGRVYLIDFGLAEYTSSIEDLAVDVHLFRRAVESTHAPYASSIIDYFVKGYLSESGSIGGRVLERAEEIRLRGRYVEERRRSVWGI